MLCKHLLLPALLSASLGITLFSCGSGEAETETWDVPTQGLVTTVREVSNDEYKIASEEPVGQIADSRIIVEDMAGMRDTFTLDQAKLMAADSTNTRSRPFRSAGMGYFGYIMLGRMMGGGPRSGAYVDNNAYNRAGNTAGSSMRSSSRRVTRTKSGFGAGKSTRSFGG